MKNKYILIPIIMFIILLIVCFNIEITEQTTMIGLQVDKNTNQIINKEFNISQTDKKQIEDFLEDYKAIQICNLETKQCYIIENKNLD